MKVRASTFWELPWFVDRTGYDPPPGFRGLVAVGADSRIRGFIGFDRWTPASACMHVAVDSPGACRGLLRAAFVYLFQETGRVLARAEVRANNAASLEATKRVGFREVFRTLDGWAQGEDLVHFELRRDECRWLREEKP